MTTDPMGTLQVQNVLITGGRAPVALELSRMLKAKGCRVFVAESAEHHLCRVSAAVELSIRVPSPRHSPEAYIEQLAKLVEKLRIDILIPLCEEIFYIAAGIDRLVGYRVLAAGAELLARLHHKWEFIVLASELGFAVPETKLIRSAAEWKNVSSEAARNHESLVFKPAYSRFASRVILPRKASGGKLSRTFAVSEAPAELSSAAPWVAQQYIQGNAVCTYSVVHQGTVVAHAAYGSRYRTGKAGASVYFEPLEHQCAYEWVRHFTGVIGFTGQIGFDFIEAVDGTLYPIECNPRATSGIHLFAPEDGLVQALLHPEALVRSGTVCIPRSGRKAMLMLPMLACSLQPGPGGLRKWLQALREAEDVISRKDDPYLFREQLRVVYNAHRLARHKHISITEALTEDIEWNGEP